MEMRRKATLSGLIIYFGLKLLKPIRIELEQRIKDAEEEEAREKRKAESIDVEFQVIEEKSDQS